MRIVVIDFETFYSDDFTLKKMSTEAYVRDPRFEAHGAAIKWSAATSAQWYDARQLKHILAEEDWSDVFLVAHHANFDGLILAHHFGVRPKLWGCTLSMARLLLGNHLSVSLDSVRARFGIPAKLTPYNLFKGKHWHEMPAVVREQVAAGACDEVESIWKIFGLLAKDFPVEEYECVDTTIRMFVEPVLKGNVDKLAAVWETEARNKAARMAALGVTSEQLQSAEQFAGLLRRYGEEPETKEGKKGPIYAFAKTDTYMRDYLLEHEDDDIRLLAEARLGAKSTLLQSRAETLGFMAGRGPLCVYLRYAGAHTSRWSGGDGSNLQNGVHAINDAIEPPEGFLLVKPDASQVECRLLNFIAGQDDKIEDFRNGRDPYVGVAEAFCGHKVTKETHPDLRQAGKVVELQAGYGSGEAKIKATLKNKANIVISLDEAAQWKKSYRDTHPAVTDLWKTANRMLARLAGGPPLRWNVVEIRDSRIILPNGIPLDYSTLEFHKPEDPDEIVDGYWRLRTRDGWTKMYGAKLVENLIQALARVVVSQAMIRIKRRGYRIVNMRHDDLWILVPKDGREKDHIETCRREMCVTPAWLPGIPLDAEVH